MNVVSYGAGTNSTALLIGLHQKGIPVDLILFADPGSEQPYTYEYLPIMDGWLARHRMPCIQTVYCTDRNGDRLTLEQEILRRQMDDEMEAFEEPPALPVSGGMGQGQVTEHTIPIQHRRPGSRPPLRTD